MILKSVNKNFYVADQPGINDLETIAAKGIRTLICNRPESELVDLPSFADLSQRAAQLDITAHYLPVVHDTINSVDVRRFTDLLQTEPAPVLAWCRSGQRSMTLWCLSRLQQGDTSASVIATARALGFDFSNLPGKFAHVIAELGDS